MGEKTDKHRRKRQPGPDPDRLKLEGDWKDRLAQAVKKPRPKGGWPKPTIRRKLKKKS